MFRRMALCGLLALAAGPALSDPAAPGFLARIAQLQPDRILPAACCKICRKGKACGNSCISRDKACHKSAGCACNS